MTQIDLGFLRILQSDGRGSRRKYLLGPAYVSRVVDFENKRLNTMQLLGSSSRGTMANKFTFQGRTFFHEAKVITPEELFKIVGASADVRNRSRLIEVKAAGTYVVDGNVDLSNQPNLDTIPRGTVKGSREIFIKAQVASIAEVYGERYGLPVQIDPSLRYLFIPRFPLPGRWGARESPILIDIPAQYPEKPPDGFYISSRCHGPHIFSRQVRTGQDLSSYGWNWSCVHCDAGWKAGVNPMDPCNLWTVLKVVRTFLTVGEF